MRLLQMSISAGVLISVILVLRRGTGRLFSAGFIYLLWFIAAARMLLPVSVPVQLPGIGFGTVWQGDGFHDDFMLFPHAAWEMIPGEGREAVEPAAFPAGHGRLAALVWADVCLLLLILSAWTYIRQYRQLEESIPLRDNGYLDHWRELHPMRQRVSFMCFDRLRAPVTYGIWNTRIVFPKSMDLQDTCSLNHILLHEYVHIRRFDNLWKIVVLAAVCVHWFNPLAWVMWICFNRDMELACDQRAMEGMDKNGRLAYAMTLLRYAEKNHKVSLLCSGFGKSSVKERIMMIMKNNKRTRIGIVCSALVLAMSTTVFASVRGVASSGESIMANEAVSTMGSGAGEDTALVMLGKSPARMLSEVPQFREYEAKGLYYDPVMDMVSYENRTVGYVLDEYSRGKFNQMNDLAGKLCLVAQRDGDGTLTGFMEVEETDYLKNASDAERRMAYERAYIREYGDHGVSCDPQTGYLSYGGKLVEAIRDSGGCGIYVNGAQTQSDDTTCLQIERDDSNGIIAVKEMTPEEMSQLLRQTIGVYRVEGGWKGVED